jgi:hypothetical protein
MPDFPSRMLFRPVALCPHMPDGWAVDGDLSEWAGLEPLPPLQELDGERPFARIWLAWSPAGLHIAQHCHKPLGPVSSNRRRPHSADGLQVWVDTRATQNVHRATRFCHYFVLLPRGGGAARERAMAWQGRIRRARERPAVCRPEDIQIASQVHEGHYTLEALLPAHILSGFDPRPGARLGFTYFVHDIPGGKQVWSAPRDLPFDTDPSLWGTVELVG